MTASANRERMAQFYEKISNRKEFGVIDDLVAEDVIDHMPLPGMPPGRAGLRVAMEMILGAFPDARFTIHNLTADEDRVVGVWSMDATHTGAIFGIPPTGRPVHMSGIDAIRWRDGQAAEIWHVEEVASMLMQIGAVPPPGGPPA
ncbi:MAG: ester cyclase [Dehalococcoidia bacterium]